MDRDELKLYGAIIGIVLLIVALPLYQAKRQAEIFNRCTGSHVTTWDALWADLRITECKGGK